MSEEQKPEPRYLAVRAVTLNDENEIREVVLSDGSILVGIQELALQKGGAEGTLPDGRQIKADVLDLRLIGEIETWGGSIAEKPPEQNLGKVELQSSVIAPRPATIHVPRQKPLIGADGKPVAS